MLYKVTFSTIIITVTSGIITYKDSVLGEFHSHLRQPITHGLLSMKHFTHKHDMQKKKKSQSTAINKLPTWLTFLKNSMVILIRIWYSFMRAWNRWCTRMSSLTICSFWPRVSPFRASISAVFKRSSISSWAFCEDTFIKHIYTTGKCLKES